MIVNLAGLFLIGFIVWWFWVYKAEAVKPVTNKQQVTVENGIYTPSIIAVKTGETIRLEFIRKDPSPCAEKVIFDELGLSFELPVDQEKEIEVIFPEPGEYSFSCQMQMYRGKVIAES